MCPWLPTKWLLGTPGPADVVHDLTIPEWSLSAFFFCSGSNVQKQVRLSVRNMVDKGQTCAENDFRAQLRLQRWAAAYPESGKVALLANAG